MPRYISLAVFAVVSAGAFAGDVQIGSTAQVWQQKSLEEKRQYMQGFCEGALANDIGRMVCSEGKRDTPPTTLAFCLTLSAVKGKTPVGIRHLDDFYQDPKHSDVPLLAAVRVFNDKACKEDRATSEIPAIQAKFVCMRQASQMMAMKVSDEAVAAQNAKCRSLP